jgi:hypothetical protein
VHRHLARLGDLLEEWLGYQIFEQCLHCSPVELHTAAQAVYPVEAAVQVDDPAVPCALMQPINVLGDDLMDNPGALQRGQRPMGRIWQCLLNPRPADQTAGPITPAGPLVTQEFLQPDRRTVPPAPVRAPVVRDSGGRAAARACEHQQLTPLDNELGKCS